MFDILCAGVRGVYGSFVVSVGAIHSQDIALKFSKPPRVLFRPCEVDWLGVHLA